MVDVFLWLNNNRGRELNTEQKKKCTMNDEDWLKKRNYKKGVGCVMFMLVLLFFL